MNENTTIKEVIEHLDDIIASNDVKDAVHKIKFMTTRDMLQELLKKG